MPGLRKQEAWQTVTKCMTQTKAVVIVALSFSDTVLTNVVLICLKTTIHKNR